MEKYVIINADDFGMCGEVNEAVRKAHTEGVLTSASIMVNMGAAEQAVAMAKALPGLGVGVHLNLSKAKPICKEPIVKCLLNRDGEFGLSKLKLFVLSIYSDEVRRAALAELGAQIQWLVDRGIQPTHLDSHYHIHSFPGLFSIVCRLASHFKIRAIRWVYEPGQVSGKPWPMSSDAGKGKARFYRVLARINRFQNKDFLKSGAFLGIAHTGRIDVNFFKAAALYNYAAVTEVMTHPAVNSDVFDSQTGLQREAELKGLCDDRAKRQFSESGIKLVHYGQL
jgi:predicted glycoside hydrolase/deacetylase ChbG (UPF0249 family)